MVIFRKYRITDFEEYHSFCKRNFGGHSYQSRQNYVDWLYDKYCQSFAIALNNFKVVGIEHNFKAPIFVDGNCEFVTVLHDLMVDDVDRGSVGFRLMRDSLKADDYLVLPGSVGRLSRAYGRLGSKKFSSFWYRKFQIPMNFFRSISQKRLLNFEKLARDKNLLFGHNKQVDNRFLEKALKPFRYFDQFSEFFNWRFFHERSPLTFYVTDPDGDNSVLFVLGKKGKIPYARIFYVHLESEVVYKKMIRLIEKITSRLGVPVVLHTSFERAPPANLGYKVYADIPVSYVYSGVNKDRFEVIVPSFCSDIGFDGLNLLTDA